MRLLTILTCFLCVSSQVLAEQIKLTLDLEIKEPEGIIFNKPEDIATDSKNNVYVLDKKEKALYIFSEMGKFIKKAGRPGHGPGELERPRSVYIDANNLIYILDRSNRRIEIFDSDAEFVRSIKILKFPTGNRQHLIVDDNGNFLISGYYLGQQNLVGKFLPTGELIEYFSLPVIEYTGLRFDKENDRIMINQFLIGGSLCFDDEKKIYFSYSWPYLMKVLTPEGKTLFQFSRKHQFNWTPFIFRTDRQNGMLFGESTRTLKLFFLNHKHLVNSIFVSNWEGDPNKKIVMSVINNDSKKYFVDKGQFAVLDFYTKNGEFITSTKIDEKIYFLCSDKKERILGIKYGKDDLPVIVRYQVHINENK